MLEMLVVDRMGMIRWVSAIRIRSSARSIGRSRCHPRGSMRREVTVQAVMWWRLSVLLSVPIVIRVRIIITWVGVGRLLVGHRCKGDYFLSG